MSKKKKIDERTVEVSRGDNSYREAQEVVKKVSGFDHCLCIRAKLTGSQRELVEYEFLVSNDPAALQAVFFDAQMRNERTL
jgi:hypothetical protein